MKSLFVFAVAFLALAPSVVQAGNLPKSPAPSSPAVTVMTYSVYAGGIHAVDAELKLTLGKDSYQAELSAGTRGFLKTVADWSGEFRSQGAIGSALPLPKVHKSASTWKGETETKTFTYDGRGHFVSYAVDVDGKNTTPDDLDKDLAKGATDVLSATLSLMMMLPREKLCQGDNLVFDGDRSYRLQFADTHVETLKKSDYNSFSGEAVACTVEVKPEKGKWRKKPRGWLSIQEQGRQKGALPTVWFGQVDGLPNSYVPVKIRVKTDYGTLFMHLTSVKS